MTNLFERQVELIVAEPLSSDFSTVSAKATQIKDLRVAFKVTKTLVKDPNTAEIKVYNLAASTRAALPGKGAKIILKAGYPGTLAQIYIGDARLIESKRDGTDWITTFRCGDGERAVLNARVSASFGPGVPYANVITDLAKAAKVDIGNLGKVVSSLPPSQQYTQGYAAHGLALTELDKVLRAAGLEYSIQDGALQVLGPGETTTEEVIELSAETGLVGSPEMGTGDKADGGNKAPAKPVLQAKSLLQGGFRPGRRVNVISLQYKGLCRLQKVEHFGDTRGGDFYSNLELEVK